MTNTVENPQVVESRVTEVSLVHALRNIQREIVVPKKRFNEYAKYYYSNAEDILASLKPLLIKNEVTLMMSHSSRTTDRVDFLEFKVVLTNGSETIEHTYSFPIFYPTNDKINPNLAYGGTVSYAKKYALSSLFLVEDGIDSDSLNQGPSNQGPSNQGHSNQRPSNQNIAGQNPNGHGPYHGHGPYRGGGEGN